jgi:hypothetical protein
LVLPNVTITKVRLAWVWLPLPASHQVADLDHGFPAAGSSARNVTGGRKLARHDSWVLYPWTLFLGAFSL